MLLCFASEGGEFGAFCLFAPCSIDWGRQSIRLDTTCPLTRMQPALQGAQLESAQSGSATAPKMLGLGASSPLHIFETAPCCSLRLPRLRIVLPVARGHQSSVWAVRHPGAAGSVQLSCIALPSRFCSPAAAVPPGAQSRGPAPKHAS